MGVREILEDLERGIGEPGIRELVPLLKAESGDRNLLFRYAERIKEREIGKKVHFRGLVEFSNLCEKDCYYCGIRRSNRKVRRYNLTDEQILESAAYAWKNNYGSLVLQSGELRSSVFTERIERLLLKIAKLSGGKLGVTLSLGEQDATTYERWFQAGAHRYLLRIETSRPDLYEKLHPGDQLHGFPQRLEALNSLKSIGYQTGTGVMIGLPFQRLEDLAEDLLFMKEFDVDMVGMGPYIEHRDTPLIRFHREGIPVRDRFELALNMVATLRMLMPDINIAAATALQAIDPLGREKAIRAGANILMPNLTPGRYRNDYSLYENKPCVDEEPDECRNCMDVRMHLAVGEIGYGEWGDSRHYHKRTHGTRS